MAGGVVEEIESEPSADGRVLRGARNRERIIEALMALVGEGTIEPTAEQVAARAGVGTRTVFRHFADMDTLFQQLCERLRMLLGPLFLVGRPEGDVLDRAIALLHARCELYERAAPHERATRFYKARNAFVRKQHDEILRAMADEVEQVLSPEVGVEAGPVLYALQLGLSFASWDQLRTGVGLDQASVVEVLEHQIRAVLERWHQG